MRVGGRGGGQGLQTLVGKGLTHSLGDVFGADAEDVEQLLRLPAAGDPGHGQPGHHDAGLLAHGREDGLPQTTWNQTREEGSQQEQQPCNKHSK